MTYQLARIQDCNASQHPYVHEPVPWLHCMSECKYPIMVCGAYTFFTKVAAVHDKQWDLLVVTH